MQSCAARCTLKIYLFLVCSEMLESPRRIIVRRGVSRVITLGFGKGAESVMHLSADVWLYSESLLLSCVRKRDSFPVYSSVRRCIALVQET